MRFGLVQGLIDDLTPSRPRLGRYIGFYLRPIDRRHHRSHQTYGNTQRHHPEEHSGNGVETTATEPSQRGMIR